MASFPYTHAHPSSPSSSPCQAQVAEQCFAKAKDLGGLLLMASSKADAAAMASLGAMAGAGELVVVVRRSGRKGGRGQIRVRAHVCMRVCERVCAPALGYPTAA